MTAAATTIRSLAALFAIALSLSACTHSTAAGDAQTTGVALQQGQLRIPSDDAAFDRELVRQLVAAGADVNKPARMVYSLYIPSRSDAETAARQLRADGYRASVQKPVGKLPDGRTETRTWLLAGNEAAPSLDHARRVRPYFESIARRYHGEYSGWGANVVK